MSDVIYVKEAARQWGLTERSVTGMCKSGKIPGAYKQGKMWYIPADAERPADGRVREDIAEYNVRRPRLPLPVGISDYKVASTQYYYVDKTMFIKDFIDERPMVSLFTRPRRFGKTLGMDMLRTFFEKTDEDTSVYFRKMKIWRQGSYYRNYQGKYPVIFVSFKDIKCETWDETVIKLSEVIGNEYARHSELLESEECNEVDKEYFRLVMHRKADALMLSSAFMTITKMLHEHHHIAPIIIIDEYDTPIQQGHSCGFYDQVIMFMRNLFSGGLKDNKHLSFGFLTGILRVAKESIFSGLNNLAVNSILDEKYSSYFGFTRNDVEEIAAYYEMNDRMTEIEEWYDGYRFGDDQIYNPWSVINYFNNNGRPRAFWSRTSGNDLIRQLVSNAGEEVFSGLERLLQGGEAEALIDTDIIFPEVEGDSDTIFSFLLASGYLKIIDIIGTIGDNPICSLAIPNKEVQSIFRKKILDEYSIGIGGSVLRRFEQALRTEDNDLLTETLQQYLMQSAGYLDTSGESFYHGTVFGMLAIMSDSYYIRSNRESGDGRFDVQLEPKNKKQTGYIIEFKAGRNISEQKLGDLAGEAIAQILDKRYDTEMHSRGINDICLLGIAFSGKHVAAVKRKK